MKQKYALRVEVVDDTPKEMHLMLGTGENTMPHQRVLSPKSTSSLIVHPHAMEGVVVQQTTMVDEIGKDRGQATGIILSFLDYIYLTHMITI